MGPAARKGLRGSAERTCNKKTKFGPTFYVLYYKTKFGIISVVNIVWYKATIGVRLMYHLRSLSTNTVTGD